MHSLCESKIMPDFFSPLNFKKWIEDNRSQFKPPVGNKQIWADREFMVTVVGGPNERSDYHINEGEEFPDACFRVCWSHKVGYDDLATAYDLECLSPRALPKTVLVAGYGWPAAVSH